MSVRQAKAFLLCPLLSAVACLATPALPSALASPAVESEFRSAGAPGASVAVVRDGRVQHLDMGAERSGGAPVTERTIFQIASLTKPFTAIVILRLAEQERLGLDDRAKRWLTWLPDRYREVTVRQLLNHTSGVPRDLRRENVDEFGIEEFRRRFVAAEPSFGPGERWEYSNTGYILLSLVAEEASGARFGDLLDRFVFRPLDMRRTAYRAPLGQGRGRAAGHDLVEGAWRPAPAIYSGFGNSGIETTAADLARFATALHRRRLLRPESYATMLAPAVLGSGAPVQFQFRDAPASYGLGWFLTEICGERVIMHGGTIAGFSSNFIWTPGQPLAAIALSNGKSRPDRIGVADGLAAAAFRAAAPCEP